MTMTSDPSAPSTLQAFRSVPRTGVVYVTKEASARGYRTGHPEWSNLGQGQPRDLLLDLPKNLGDPVEQAHPIRSLMHFEGRRPAWRRRWSRRIPVSRSTP
jgi:hypothetical protein